VRSNDCSSDHSSNNSRSSLTAAGVDGGVSAVGAFAEASVAARASRRTAAVELEATATAVEEGVTIRMPVAAPPMVVLVDMTIAMAVQGTPMARAAAKSPVKQGPAAAVLALLRLFGRLYDDAAARGSFDLLFVLTVAAPLGFQGAQHWVRSPLYLSHHTHTFITHTGFDRRLGGGSKSMSVSRLKVPFHHYETVCGRNCVAGQQHAFATPLSPTTFQV
jgi:hypothetical protein